MAKDKEAEFRMQGMSYALQIAKKDGIDGLEKEMKRRGITKVPFSTSQAELKRVWDELASNMYNNVTMSLLYAIREEYGFGAERIARLMNRYEKVVKDCIDVDYMGEHYVRLEDYAKELNEKTDVDLDVERIANCMDTYDKTAKNSDYHMARIERLIEELDREGYTDAAEFLKKKIL